MVYQPSPGLVIRSTGCRGTGGGWLWYLAPLFEADVDDTARVILCPNTLGYNSSPNRMIEMFETDGHFRTYQLERDPSLSANCNVLLALLHTQNIPVYSSQIYKVTIFLCDHWWMADGRTTDKRNLSYLCPSLLLVEAFVDLLVHVERGEIPEIESKGLR
ncbi:hypothetical protein F4677DRAFT_253908 [Hypoxylon crocopeplum]|nr:hypothetical protein F4677DRAFT_253908 [Hypoxylon crocopeplum]